MIQLCINIYPGVSSGKESAFQSLAGAARDADLIPGLGRSPGGGNDNDSSILVGIIPWQEKPGGLYSP